MLTSAQSFIFFISITFYIVQGQIGDRCGCDRTFKPVCGTDGQTYENICQLTCDQRYLTALKLAYAGTCCPKAEFCTTFIDPVCDNFGETHPNECVFSYKQCVVRRSRNVSLRIAKKGVCDKYTSTQRIPCNFFCDETEELLCDDQGHTHNNLCKFELAKCRRVTRGLVAPEIKHMGECNASSESNELRLSPRAKPVMHAVPSASVWNYGTFPPPPAIPIVDPPELDPYDFGSSRQLPTERTTIRPTTNGQSSSTLSLTGVTNPSSEWPPTTTAYQKTSISSKPDITAFKTTDNIDFPRPDSFRSSTTPSTTFNNCLSCDDEVDQVPVCDNYNQTHGSICRLARWNCERRESHLEERVLVHIGACNVNSLVFTMEEEVCPSKCSKKYKPVCDTDGVTHPNLCAFQMFNCEQRKKNNKYVSWLLMLRECPQDEEFGAEIFETQTTPAAAPPAPSPNDSGFDCPRPQCPAKENTICDSEGVYHKNECEFAFARCLAAKRGIVLTPMPVEACSPTVKCAKNVTISSCTNLFDPVCATDFVTYPNLCHFQVAQCSNDNLDILFKGECKKCLNVPCPIVSPADPLADDALFLCDQNGETKSRCEFDMLRCIYNLKFGYNITEAYGGRCCLGNELCPMESKPVCDSNGNTHRNLCYFNVAKCRTAKIAAGTLEMVPCPEDSEFDMIGLSEPSDCFKTACTNQYDPICGSNGETYTNLCHFQQRQCNEFSLRLEVLYKGACCEEKCSLVDFSPVCDSENVTHLNICEFGRERCLAARRGNGPNITIVEYNACASTTCNTTCPPIYDPICASNGETFSNECELNKALCILDNSGGTSMSVDYPGECCKQEECDLLFEPVCDSDGRTHVNECIFRQQACIDARKNGINSTVVHPGECCNRPCDDKDDQAICDTNGITHESLCQFSIQQCQSERAGNLLSIAYIGRCCEVPSGECQNTTAICDSDGQSHVNKCEYDYKKCIVEKTQPKTLSIIHLGTCCTLDKCVNEREPICDSQGVTHQSVCHFNNSRCIHEKIHGGNASDLQVAYKGTCCELDCTDIWEPVCDQHGTTYRNKCVFEHSACEISKKAGDVAGLVITPCSKQVRLHELQKNNMTG